MSKRNIDHINHMSDTHYAEHDDRSDLDDARWLVWLLVGALVGALLVMWWI